MRALVALLVFVAGTAHADLPATTDVTRVLEKIVATSIASTMKLPRFTITNHEIEEKPTDYGALLFGTNAPTGDLTHPVAGVSSDGTAGWVSGDITPVPCQRGALPDDTTGDSSYYEGERCMWEEKGAFARGALIVELDGTAWQPVAWHLYGLAPGYIGTAEFHALAESIADGARDAEKLFASSIADPKALVKSLSTRKDVVMFGSAKGERFVGAKKIGATITKWNLAFKVRGGAVAGTAGKSVAWVGANLDARSIKNAKAKPSFYRVLFVYEHTGEAWQLVQASFSDVKPPL